MFRDIKKNRYISMSSAEFAESVLNSNYIFCIDTNITVTGDLGLEVPSCISSNRKLKPEVRGHWARSYLNLS